MDRNSKSFIIYTEIKRNIASGQYKEGSQLPTEAELTKVWGVSRPTASKALNALEAEGLVVRSPGSGSYVAQSRQETMRGLLGLIVPALGTNEIFEPICARLASLSDAHGYSLLWGGSLQEGSRRGSEIERLARHYVDSGVAGVYFAPIESCPEYAAINKNAISILETAKVPLVLLDSDYLAFPERSAFDLVGIDHLRAGYEATAHLLSHGTRRVDFIKSPDSGAAVALRVRGYREALLDAGIAPRQEWVHEGNPDAHHFIQALLAIPDLSDIVCQNDEMAAALMKALEAFQVAIPDRLRLVGFDDVKYARHLRVPLTTIRQPCEEIAACAVELMVARIGDPLLPVKSLYLKSHLVERASSGSA